MMISEGVPNSTPICTATCSKFVAVPNSWRTAGSARVEKAGSVFKCACSDVLRDATGPRGISLVWQIHLLAVNDQVVERPTVPAVTAWQFLRKILGDPSRVKVTNQLTG